jgi:FK506-binding protein 2
MLCRKPEKCDNVTKAGYKLKVNYEVRLFDTEELFDSSYERDDPFIFRLGEGLIIKGYFISELIIFFLGSGWEEGLLGMCIGEKRRLIVPAELGYGRKGIHDLVPPNSALIYEVELLNFSTKPGKKRFLIII